MFLLIPEEFLIIKWDCPHRDGSHFNRFGWADEWDRADNSVLCCHQDDSKMDVLPHSTGNLNQRCFLGDDMMCVLDVVIVRFPQMLGEVKGWESVNNGVNR